MIPPPSPKSESTPGPWESGSPHAVWHVESGKLIATIEGPLDGVSAEQRANAALIASAPTLKAENTALRTALAQAREALGQAKKAINRLLVDAVTEHDGYTCDAGECAICDARSTVRALSAIDAALGKDGGA